MNSDKKPPQAVIDAHKNHKFSNTPEGYYRSNLKYCTLIANLSSSGLIQIPDRGVYAQSIWRFLGGRCSYDFPSYAQAVWVDGQIEGFTSILELWKGKPVRMNPGKFIRKLVPFLTDLELESVVADLKRTHSPLEFELIVSKESESFSDAYETDYCPKRSPDFSDWPYGIKRLDSSCMRGTWEFGEHPAIAYAGPDLAVIYCKEKETGKIGARVVAYPDKKTCTYIYSVDDTASRMICDYLQSEGYSQSGLKGARMSKIKGGEGWLMPYVDHHTYCSDIGEYWKLGSGDICCQNCSGYIENRDNEEMCYDCNEYYDSEEMVQVNGNCICRHCLRNNYVYSSLEDEYILVGESYSTGDGEYATQEYFESNCYVMDNEGYYQIESECVEFDGEYYHESSHHVTSFDGKNYHEDSEGLKEAIAAKEKEDKTYQVKETWAFDYAPSKWEEFPHKAPTPAMGYRVTTERTLRDNYQINSNGEPERIADFLDLLEVA
jgi:hypothetical protein